jgi:hypothetical protein
MGEKGSSGADAPPEVDTEYVHEKERKGKERKEKESGMQVQARRRMKKG